MKDLIIQYLEERDMYHTSDELLIDELLFNVEMMTTAKTAIREDGIMIDITRDPDKDPFFQKNRAVDVYQQALKAMTGLMRQLALTPQERQKLKLSLLESEDEFDQNFK